jgi:hypothetical protein
MTPLTITITITNVIGSRFAFKKSSIPRYARRPPDLALSRRLWLYAPQCSTNIHFDKIFD